MSVWAGIWPLATVNPPQQHSFFTLMLTYSTIGVLLILLSLHSFRILLKVDVKDHVQPFSGCTARWHSRPACPQQPHRAGQGKAEGPSHLRMP